MQLPFEIERNTDLIRREIESVGADLVEIAFYRGHGKARLVITADKAGGISLDDCAEISRRVGSVLDELMPSGGADCVLSTPYDLEVVSHGLDRPLKTQKEFSKAVGEIVKVAFKKEDGSTATWKGHLVLASENDFELRLKDGAVKKIAYLSVLHAAREILFGRNYHER